MPKSKSPKSKVARAKPLKRKLKATEFYCVKCRKAVKCDDSQIKFRNVRNKKRKGGVPMLQCTCNKC